MSVRFVSIVVMLGGLLLAGTSDGAPFQELEHRDGYVPVYIREGDTPLLEINPKLAEAFNEIDSKNLIEQVVLEPELERKPDLILMTVDNGDAILSIPSADQLASEDQPAEVIEIIQPLATESDLAEVPQPSQGSDQSEDTIETVEVVEAPQPDEAVRELESVPERETLKTLAEPALAQPEIAGDIIVEEPQKQPAAEEEPLIQKVEAEQVAAEPAVDEQPAVKEASEEKLAAAVKLPTEAILEVTEIKEEPQLLELPVPEQSARLADDADNKPSQNTSTDDDDNKPEDPATDVSSVSDFKTREIDVKSIETEKIDVPEESRPDTVSTDE